MSDLLAEIEERFKNADGCGCYDCRKVLPAWACLLELLDLCDEAKPCPDHDGTAYHLCMSPTDVRAVISRHFPTQEDGG